MIRIAPVWAYALNRSRKAARLGAEVRRLRQELAVSNALAEHRRAQVLDLEARYRRLEANHDFLVAGRLGLMARHDSSEGTG